MDVTQDPTTILTADATVLSGSLSYSSYAETTMAGVALAVVGLDYLAEMMEMDANASSSSFYFSSAAAITILAAKQHFLSGRLYLIALLHRNKVD